MGSIVWYGGKLLSDEAACDGGGVVCGVVGGGPCLFLLLLLLLLLLLMTSTYAVHPQHPSTHPPTFREPPPYHPTHLRVLDEVDLPEEDVVKDDPGRRDGLHAVKDGKLACCCRCVCGVGVVSMEGVSQTLQTCLLLL